MADIEITVERYEDGVLVSSQTFTRPAEDVNRDTITERAVAALGNNADYLDLASPTQAQAVAQVAALTRQVNGLIRIALQRFDSAD